MKKSDKKSILKIVSSFFLLFAMVSFIACQSNEDDNTSFPQDIDFTTIAKGENVGGENIPQQNVVITNQEDFNNLMEEMSVNFTETTIDFDNYMVVGVILEVKKSGWEIEITNVEEQENQLVVSTKETPYETTVMRQPYCIVKIPKIDKPVVFVY